MTKYAIVMYMSESNSHSEIAPGILGVGHYELKTAMLAIAASTAEGQKPVEWRNELVARQGDEKGWEPITDTVLRVCQSLGSAGLLKAVLEGDEKAGYYFTNHNKLAATDKAVKYGLPFAGAVLEWGLRHPSVSTQTLLGDGDKLANTRLTILEGSLADEDLGIPRAELARSFGKDRAYADKHIKELTEREILESTPTTSRRVNVRVAPEYRPAVRDLVQTIKDYQGNPESDELRAAAVGIISSPEKMAQLMDKSRESNKNARTPDEKDAAKAKVDSLLEDPDMTARKLQAETGLSTSRAQALTPRHLKNNGRNP